MDILTFEYILKGLKDYNGSVEKNYGNEVVSLLPKNATFPLTILTEVRNLPYRGYNHCQERISSLGVMVKIYANNKGSKHRDEIARLLAKNADDYLNNIGLVRVSYNYNDGVYGEGVYEIIMTYSGTHNEYRQRFI